MLNLFFNVDIGKGFQTKGHIVAEDVKNVEEMSDEVQRDDWNKNLPLKELSSVASDAESMGKVSKITEPLHVTNIEGQPKRYLHLISDVLYDIPFESLFGKDMQTKENDSNRNTEYVKIPTNRRRKYDEMEVEQSTEDEKDRAFLQEKAEKDDTLHINGYRDEAEEEKYLEVVLDFLALQAKRLVKYFISKVDYVLSAARLGTPLSGLLDCIDRASSKPFIFLTVMIMLLIFYITKWIVLLYELIEWRRESSLMRHISCYEKIMDRYVKLTNSFDGLIDKYKMSEKAHRQEIKDLTEDCNELRRLETLKYADQKVITVEKDALNKTMAKLKHEITEKTYSVEDKSGEIARQRLRIEVLREKVGPQKTVIEEQKQMIKDKNSKIQKLEESFIRDSKQIAILCHENETISEETEHLRFDLYNAKVAGEFYRKMFWEMKEKKDTMYSEGTQKFQNQDSEPYQGQDQDLEAHRQDRGTGSVNRLWTIRSNIGSTYRFVRRKCSALFFRRSQFGHMDDFSGTLII